MITFRQINIENRPYYIFNDMINIKYFDPNLLSIFLKYHLKIQMLLSTTLNISQ